MSASASWGIVLFEGARAVVGGRILEESRWGLCLRFQGPWGNLGGLGQPVMPLPDPEAVLQKNRKEELREPSTPRQWKEAGQIPIPRYLPSCLQFMEGCATVSVLAHPMMGWQPCQVEAWISPTCSCMPEKEASHGLQAQGPAQSTKGWPVQLETLEFVSQAWRQKAALVLRAVPTRGPAQS